MDDLFDVAKATAGKRWRKLAQVSMERPAAARAVQRAKKIVLDALRKCATEAAEEFKTKARVTKLAKAKGSTDPPPIDPPDPVDPDSVAEIEFTLEAIANMEDDLTDALAEISERQS